ncbi:pullulanase-type alpha-1,6-glucosidase [Parvularcula maris]|uniref:Pullulanase-type alpha-1,6-glucosidase n=1 Tax=Parvularcula maris TaxID=2965077 RepID=A0A9X2LBF6_9PROT|nr:pullulanase-type alpha-1,6-glucosidase [Parvularcula maris]MCQ8186649.1 pullulanase-type alpha-1,6-glucosidase [Parvularcula maris]
MGRFVLLIVTALFSLHLGVTASAQSGEGEIAAEAREQRGYWLSRRVIVLPLDEPAEVVLRSGSEADAVALHPQGGLSADMAARFPHLRGMASYRLPVLSRERLIRMLRGDLVVEARRGGELVLSTGLQLPGVLDDLFANEEPLGVRFEGGVPVLSVWAPTATSVRLALGEGDEPEFLDMAFDPETGIWSARGEENWYGRPYRYEVTVHRADTGRVHTNLVTDPYSVALTTDSTHSLILDLSSDDLKPESWDNLEKPSLEAPEDIAIYELHVRDFSIADATVPADERGKFEAFSRTSSNGMQHLLALEEAGLTHIHLLPSFDCATIPEAGQKTPPDLTSYGPGSARQQAILEEHRATDGFNWCYDPYHYTVPEGSYAADTDGAARTLAFREMVSSLNRNGLRVVMDVVYNHTTASGQAERSVLDKIVPGYYHRLLEDGRVATSTCCANTATEHRMMERLMVDSLLTWAKAYKVDGFRFDLMGHHSRENMLKVKEALSSLTTEEDGVDGSAIYLYGEGWDFGEVSGNARFVQATQAQMGQDTGVGSFNDRLRDAVRGGRPFDTGIQHVQNQGLANGLYTDPNEERPADDGAREEWLAYADLARLGLAGQLSGYRFEGASGEEVTGADVLYFGTPGAGYASDPQEAINYVAAHDNETLFDIYAYKLPLDSSPTDRVRSQVLATSFVLLAQGIPLLHAGQDMLRSKSLDRNSYDSGDWFNLLDFSYQDNGWGRGLPPRQENEANWEEQRAFLTHDDIKPEPRHIAQTAALTREYLQIRSAEPLFRLRTAEDVQRQVRFLNTGPDQEIGLIVMTLGEDEAAPELVVVFNTKAERASFDTGLESDYALHAVQQKSADGALRTASMRSGTASVPARSAVVFVRR